MLQNANEDVRRAFADAHVGAIQFALTEPSSWELLLFRYDIGCTEETKTFLKGMIDLSINRMVNKPRYTGQILHGRWKRDGRVYREISTDVFEDITEHVGGIFIEPSPPRQWWVGLTGL